MRVDVASVMAAAGDETESGDFWLQDDDGVRCRVVVGDTAGHGADAAESARSVRAAFARHLSTIDPCDLLEAVNTDLGVLEERFVTAVVVDLEYLTSAVRWSYAGHLPPFRLSDGQPLRGAAPGLPLGVQDIVGCGTATSSVGQGDGLLLFTDGLEDVVGPGGDRFGTARISRRLGDLVGRPVDEIVQGLKATACDFGSGVLPDDLCVVAVRRR